MVYVRWEGEHEAVVRLVEAEGKLSLLSLKGETVRSEMCGAVFAARLSKFVKKNYRYQFTKFYHFIDSMTVLGAINKESYGFSTFYANRVGEIQSATKCDNTLKPNDLDLLVFTELANTIKYGGGLLYNLVFTE